MKVSVITVVYNGVDTIRDCIESVIYQTHTDIEYIVIDGGSTDGTQKIIEEYKDKGYIDYFVSKKDNGIYDAMNKGIKLSTGEVIALLNSDDFYARKDALSIVAKEFEKDKEVGCVYGDLNYVDKNNTSKIRRIWKSRQFKPGMFKIGWHPPHTAFFVRKSTYEKYGLYRTDMKIASDYELMLRFLERERVKSVYIPRTLVKMRIGGISNSSLISITKGNKESISAWKKNKMRVPWWIFITKPLIKISQIYYATIKTNV